MDDWLCHLNTVFHGFWHFLSTYLVVARIKVVHTNKTEPPLQSKTISPYSQKVLINNSCLCAKLILIRDQASESHSWKLIAVEEIHLHMLVEFKGSQAVNIFNSSLYSCKEYGTSTIFCRAFSPGAFSVNPVGLLFWQFNMVYDSTEDC